MGRVRELRDPREMRVIVGFERLPAEARHVPLQGARCSEVAYQRVDLGPRVNA